MTPRILVFAESRGGKILRVFHEGMGGALNLARAKNGEVAVLWIGRDSLALLEELKSAGASKIFVAEHPKLEYFLDDAYAGIFYRVIQEYQPQVVLAGATLIGRVLSARVAALCDTGLVPDCVDLGWDGDRLKIVRPVWGGVSLSVNQIKKLPQMASVRPGVLQAVPAQSNVPAEVIKIVLADQDVESRLQVLDQCWSGGTGRRTSLRC